MIVIADLEDAHAVDAGLKAAALARSAGVLSLCIAAQPTAPRGMRRGTENAKALFDLTDSFDALVSTPVESVWSGARDFVASGALPQEWIADAVSGICQIINVPGHVNVDFEDVVSVLRGGRRTIIGVGTAAGPDRSVIAAQQAVSSPAATGIRLPSARGVLVVISAAKGSLKLSETKLALNTVRSWCSPDAHVIYGTVYDDRLNDSIHIMVFASGVEIDGSAVRVSSIVEPLPARATTPVVLPLKGKRRVTERPSLPSIWRTNRTVVRISEDDDVDEFEIPSFLRKRAD